jgi:hypothetical protein
VGGQAGILPMRRDVLTAKMLCKLYGVNYLFTYDAQKQQVSYSVNVRIDWLCHKIRPSGKRTLIKQHFWQRSTSDLDLWRPDFSDKLTVFPVGWRANATNKPSEKGENSVQIYRFV